VSLVNPLDVLACLAIALTLPVTSVAAGTLLVPQDHPTIQGAVDAAGDGDTILISAGTYPEEVTVSGMSNLILKAKGKVVIDASGLLAGLTLQDAPGTQVLGLRFTGGTAAALRADNCGGLVLKKCRVENAPLHGFDVETSDAALIDNCRVENVVSKGVWLKSSDGATIRKCKVTVADVGIRADGGDDLIIERCTTVQTQTFGISLDQFPGEEVTNSIISRNKIFDAESEGLRLIGSGNLLLKNVVRDCGGDGLQLLIASLTTDNVVIVNKFIRPGGMGVRCVGSGNYIVANRIVDAVGDAINMQSDSGVIALNKLVRPGGDGVEFDVFGAATITDNQITQPAENGLFIRAAATGLVCTGNKVSGSSMSGIVIEGDGGTFASNVVTGAAGDGFRLEVGSAGNVFSFNTAKGSKAGFDLNDQSGGANTIDDTNVFKTVSP